jgi:hypothetical protein
MHLLLSSTGVYSVTKIEGLAVIDSRTSTLRSVENLDQSQKFEGTSRYSRHRRHLKKFSTVFSVPESGTVRTKILMRVGYGCIGVTKRRVGQMVIRAI